ncbi:MAG: phosphoribosylamine--glycine ligase, partial [Armatimonadetes bacterium]|nr:phosphoribosylamine--glycine ligase [Armatimonadota bacterium]
AIVCDTLAAARAAARAMLADGAFGAAGGEIVIEERLRGEEASLLAVTDGAAVVPFPPAQDYKRVGDGDAGPNTGGMGAYAPAPVISPERYQDALARIVRPTLAALAAHGRPYRGCLYAGVMQTERGLQVIEFNARFGDPESQVVLPLLESDLLELLCAAAVGDLSGCTARWASRKAVCVVLASGGYPGEYQTGYPIEGLASLRDCEDVILFHAGTARREGRVVTTGGRVLNVVGLGETFAAAIRAAYSAIDDIYFEGMYCRSDIARRVWE